MSTEVYRSMTGDVVIAGFRRDFQRQGVLSPAVAREESGWLLRDWGVWSALQICGVIYRREGVRVG